MTYQVQVSTPVTSRDRRAARNAARGSLWFFEHWILVFLVFWGLLWTIPFLAPVFMKLGWTGAAELVYAVYSTQCHQMAQRSFFLFGPQPMYNIGRLPLILTVDQQANTLALRQFIGNADLGWKVAWSDRMVYMYGSLWLTGIAFSFLRRHNIQPLRWPGFIALIVPMAIDGGTHFISDVSGGLTGGFRYSNQWLANLTGNTLPAWFYAGDALGSFNSWARLVSGVLFGVAIAWLAFPYLDRSFRGSATLLRLKLAGRFSERVG